MTFDTIILGGTIVDGTRVPRFVGDIGIRDGCIAEIGRRLTGGAREKIDARGAIVAPGFVDIHTHYDAQIQWDPYCSISGWHGVTTVLMGNCGFGFAPVRPDERERAMLTLSRTEAIPVEAMSEGMPWDWITFPEWLDMLSRIPKGVNCMTLVPLAPLLVWTMGLEAAKTRGATPRERREMCELLDEALGSGGTGFSYQRLGHTSAQSDFDGSPMVTDTMLDEDLLAFAKVMRQHEGCIQTQQYTGDMNADLAFQERMAATSGRPIIHNIISTGRYNPEIHRSRLRWLDDVNGRGNNVYGQVSTVRWQFTFSLEHWNLFDGSPAWNHATTGSYQEKLKKMADPHTRAAIKAETQNALDKLRIVQAFSGPITALEVVNVAACDDPNSLASYLGRTVGEIAEAEGKDPVDVLLDISVAGQLRVEFTGRDTSYNPEYVQECVQAPYSIPGVSDGGAHAKFFTGGSYTTDFLAWMVRDEGRISLEEAHYRLSYLPACAIGLRNRGLLREGAPADIVVYDLDELAMEPPEVAYDLPGGAWRRIQRSHGYQAVFVNGVKTFDARRCTGATPGLLLRHGRG